MLDDHLVYVQANGTVMAVAFDPRHARVTGTPVPVHNRVGVSRTSNGNSEIFISPGGGLVAGRGISLGQLVWVSRDGTTRPALPGARQFSSPTLAPDGRRIAAVISDGDNRRDVWIYDPTLSILSRLTTSGTVVSLDWTPDGSSVVFATADSGEGNGVVWSQSASAGTPPRKLFAAPDPITDATISPDGRWLLAATGRSGSSIVRVGLDPASPARPYTETRFGAARPRFSPDGKWVALMSNETGEWEVYVRSFPDPSMKLQVSSGGGFLPHWSRDGSRLYYVSPSQRHPAVVAAHVTLSPTFRLLGRDTVAPIPYPDASLGSPDYAVSPEGDRVLAVSPLSSEFQLVVSPNWITELRRRLAAEARGGR